LPVPFTIWQRKAPLKKLPQAHPAVVRRELAAYPHLVRRADRSSQEKRRFGLETSGSP
jgi:hypothetical protein